ncbi:MAG TPA: universal stress protein [Atribacteraceae bacterium]|nr:universal stress protein [Atribacteraceae bacterium]
MLNITHILVPTDFSPFSDLAIQQASFFAAHFGAKITMLHVLTMAEVNALTAQPGNPWENVVGQIQNTMREQYIQATYEMAKEISEPVLEVAVGEPAEEITRYAGENKVDHLILGTHGRTGLASLFLGSVTIEVIKLTCIPITVVKCPEFMK